MKNLVLKRSFTMFALTSAVALLTLSMKSKNHTVVTSDTPYYYVSEEMAEGDFREIGHWTDNPTVGSVGCQNSGVRPCKVFVPEGYSLDDVLGTKSNAEVLAIAIDRKDAP